MSRYVISASMLDSHRLWRESEWFTDEMLAERLERREPDRPALQRDVGIAFHEQVEGADELRCPQHAFDPDRIAQLRDRYVPAGAQQEVKQRYEIDGHVITLRADMLHGMCVTDWKTRVPKTIDRMPPPLNVDRLTASLQWRIYLAAFGASVFRWLSVPCTWNQGTDWWDLGRVDSLYMHTYRDIEEDVREAVHDCVATIEWMGLNVIEVE